MEEDYIQTFQTIYRENIKREGADKLLEWLSSCDFFTAPASAKYHMAVEGGLCKHSTNVYLRLKRNIEAEYGEHYGEKVSDESIAICGLLHDVCKAEYYSVEMRNVKVNGVWEQQPYYAVKEKLPYGHGEKSVYIISGFMRLSRAEAFAINWHMGGFDDRARSNSRLVGEAYQKFPLALMLHLSDMQAAYLDENSLLSAEKSEKKA